MKAYDDFLRDKKAIAQESGFVVSQDEINQMLFPHQKDIVQWALRGGRRAIFASFGLGKSFMQLECMRLIAKHHGGRQLIIMPLGVRQEFKIDAEKLGIELSFIRRSEELSGSGIYITNYESVRDGKLDVNMFNGVSLDEASVLRSYGSKTYQNFLQMFTSVKYRFVATATPSPNRHKELIHYAGFLGVMDTGAALTRFFKRDSSKANNLQIHPHKEKEFWIWISSWAIFIQRPSDLGYDDTGYKLPKLHVHYHEVQSDSPPSVEKNGQILMFSDASLSLSDAAKEKTFSLSHRIAKMLEIISDNPNDHFLLWHDQEKERHAIKKALPEAMEVYGSQNLETREDRVIGFSNGKFKYLATKPILSGSGCNFQRYCNNAIFLGIGFKFNDFIQSVHRIYRFLQEKECHIHIIYATSEIRILEVLKKKWRQHEYMVEKMTRIIKKYGLSHKAMADALERSLGIERVEVSGDNFIIANNDCVKECENIESNSIDLIHTSIPFSNHYEYTACYDETTEVLTKRGWFLFSETSYDDEFATVNPETLLMEWEKPSEIIWRRYKGEMLHFKQKGIYDLLVTPDHKMFVDPRVGNLVSGRKHQKFELLTAKKIHDEFVYRKWRMLSAVNDKQVCNDIDFVEIPEAPCGERGPKAKKINPIHINDFLQLAGWYLSEGYCDPILKEYNQHGGRITISQCEPINPINTEEIKCLFKRIGLEPHYHGRGITVHSKSLSLFLVKHFGAKSYHKFIPQWVKDLSASNLAILRDTMMKGDGNSNGMAYTSFSERLQNDFQEICFYSGWRTSLSEQYNTVRTSQNRTSPNIRSMPKKIEYDGMIGCATVPNHTLVVRRNGKISVSGNSYNDMGHTSDNKHFWEQMDYLTPNLFRILKPGRIYACHTKDRILFGNVTGKGAPTVSPFHMEATFHAMKHGFDYLGMITVVTDVVRENNQTYRLGWSEQCKDGTKMGVGSPEYILLLRKPQTDRSKGYADTPVKKEKSEYSRSRWQIDAHAFWRSSGDRLMSNEEMSKMPMEQLVKVFKKFSKDFIYDYETHVKIGEKLDLSGHLPTTFMSLAPVSRHRDVWTNVNRMLTLNGKQAKRNLNLHICLARDSRILTKRYGFKSIQDMCVGDLVLTHKGRWRPVLAVKCTGINKAVQLKAHGVPDLKLTPTHKIWTRDVSQYSRVTDYVQKVNPTWVEASKTKGSYINLKLPQAELNSSHGSTFWWTVGRWLADGHIDQRGVAVISVGFHKWDDFCLNIGRFGGNPPRGATAHQIALKDPGHELRDVLEMCGSGAKNKHLPPEAYVLPDDYAACLLNGYLSGDGHFVKERKRWMATSVSKDLLLGLSMLVLRVHKTIASIHAGRPERKGRIEGRKVSMAQEWIISFDIPDPSRRKKQIVLDDGAWKKVRSVCDIGEVETWNIRVEEDESYTAEGCIVKNCPLQFDIVDRIIERYSAPGELVFDPFGGLGTVPLRAIMAGRKGRSVELNPESFKDSIKYLKAEEAKMKTPSLFDFFDSEREAS